MFSAFWCCLVGSRFIQVVCLSACSLSFSGCLAVFFPSPGFGFPRFDTVSRIFFCRPWVVGSGPFSSKRAEPFPPFSFWILLFVGSDGVPFFFSVRLYQLVFSLLFLNQSLFLYYGGLFSGNLRHAFNRVVGRFFFPFEMGGFFFFGLFLVWGGVWWGFER